MDAIAVKNSTFKAGTGTSPPRRECDRQVLRAQLVGRPRQHRAAEAQARRWLHRSLAGSPQCRHGSVRWRARWGRDLMRLDTKRGCCRPSGATIRTGLVPRRSGTGACGSWVSAREGAAYLRTLSMHGARLVVRSTGPTPGLGWPRCLNAGSTAPSWQLWPTRLSARYGPAGQGPGLAGHICMAAGLSGQSRAAR